MSYSCCLDCKEMVSAYEKYCVKCARDKTNDLHFWKTHGAEYYKEPLRSREIFTDKARAVDEYLFDKNKRK
jgi:hypothetical protein